MTTSRRHRFVDLVDGRELVLHVTVDGGVDVEHEGCPVGADVAIELDAYYCPNCGRGGRLSGAWVVDVVEAHRRGVEAPAAPGRAVTPAEARAVEEPF